MPESYAEQARPAVEELIPTSPAVERLLFPIPEAQALLGGLSRSFIYELIATGALRTVKAGRRRLVIGASLKEYATSLAEQAV